RARRQKSKPARSFVPHTWARSTDMGAALLQVTNLFAGYGKAEVLDGLSLHADQGKIVSVLGPNGAGKSTLLNAIGGVLPSRGTVVFDGQDISKLPVEQRLMSGIALVPEKRELF